MPSLSRPSKWFQELGIKEQKELLKQAIKIGRQQGKFFLEQVNIRPTHPRYHEILDDVIEEASIAVMRFDGGKGVSLSTFLKKTTHGKVIDYFRSIYGRGNEAKVHAEARKIKIILKAEDREATLKELKTIAAAEALKRSRNTISIDELKERSRGSSDDNETAWEGIIADTLSGDERKKERTKLRRELLEAIQQLPPRQRMAVRTAFLIHGKQREIAKKHGFSESRFSQLKRAGLKALAGNRNLQRFRPRIK